MDEVVYSGGDEGIVWAGLALSECEDFESFLCGRVAERLNDQEGEFNFQQHLAGLVTTGFESECLQEILDATVPEARDWAVGEAIAEAWLEWRSGVVWPWSSERDKKTPLASLPGADLVGFVRQGEEFRLALGEVKSSSDKKCPPNVMTGSKGMTQQLERLAVDRTLHSQLIRWLLPRCQGTEFEEAFNEAVKLFLRSRARDISLFGVLIRDVNPDEADLKRRGQKLSSLLTSPTTCELLALYLPCPISDLPGRIQQGGLS
ncbi:hypothetical protein [Microbulbifer epialgicus]|uniref:Anti-bacteriophage protein A/HamA C-terminal domain-containing protein n=1 Tax=Microbulbifer epialgicus TaxID=393907 RepID=A0ABV4P4Z2_9GAMM